MLQLTHNCDFSNLVTSLARFKINIDTQWAAFKSWTVLQECGYMLLSNNKINSYKLTKPGLPF